ncbi:hypothetical protein, partial [Haliangium sp. UPWRP_2]|uniref:hypothetical protein n=1 Tax=Haliangium sp. UPWRP_2 TaxID=1931276 RepID=UPI001304E434
VIVSACWYQQLPGLSRFKPFNDPARPLASLSKPQQEALLVGLTETIERARKVPHAPTGATSHDAPAGRRGNLAGEADALQQESRRLDAAMPSQVAVKRPTELWTQLCLPGSKGFRARLPKVTESGEEIGKKDVRAETLGIVFPKDPRNGKRLPVRLRVELRAPDFQLNEPYQDMQVFPDADSGLVIFALVPVVARPRSLLHVAVKQLMPDREWITLGTVALGTKIEPGMAAPGVPPPWLVAHLQLLSSAQRQTAGGEQRAAAPAIDAAKLEEIAQYLYLSSELLYSLLPGYVPKYDGSSFDHHGQITAGDKIFRQMIPSLQQALCEKLCAHRCKEQYDETQWVLLIEQWLVEQNFKSTIPATLLAALIIRHGIYKFC